jgi:phage minor structural protein
VLKYNALGRYKYNILGKIRYHSEFTGSLRQLTSRLGPRPIILDQDRNQIAVLDNSFSVMLDQEVGGIDEITFSLPMNDNKRYLVQPESYVQMFNTIYVIKEIVDRKKDRITEVFAEAIWYDLQYAEELTVYDWESKSATQIITDVLNGTDWKVGKVEYPNERTLHADVDNNRLEVLGNVESLYGGELYFDTIALEVSLLKPIGRHTGAGIMYEKNADDIEARYDTRDLVTRVYMYGKGNITMADANNGKPYVEDLETYTSKVRVRKFRDERFTNPFHLKETAEQALAELCKPRATYTIKLAELSTRSGLAHEQFFIGGIVKVYDKELNLNLDSRIMKWRYNVIEPWRTEITLESKPKSITDLLTGISDFDSQFVSEDTVERAEMLNLSTKNYLLNSRADDGTVYWASNGWGIDIQGHSGNASFKADGEIGVEKTLKQTVYPSSHDTYAISFKGYVENYAKGANGQVGVEVTVTYDDGSKEVKFIPLAE